MSNPVADLLHEVLIQDKEDASSLVSEVARLAGCAKSTVYDQTSARANPRVDIIAAAAAVTGDDRLFRACTPPGYKIVPDSTQANPTGPLVEELGDIHDATARARQTAKEALGDGVLDVVEKNHLQKMLGSIKAEVADVEQWLDQGGPNES